MLKDKFVNANPDVLIWARIAEGLTLLEASKKLKIPDEDLTLLEIGKSPMTLGILQKMAKVYKRSLGTFMLPKPPKEDRRQLIGITLVYSDGTEDYNNFG